MGNIFKPILYQTEMVQAILENRKNLTRRTKGLEELNKNPDLYKYDGNSNEMDVPRQAKEYDLKTYYQFSQKQSDFSIWVIACPWSIGDILWVRESFYTTSNWDHWKASALKKVGVNIYYKADIRNIDIPQPLHRGKIRPSIFLPKEYARIFLKIKSIRIERLQDISENDCIAEGASDRLKSTDLDLLKGLKDWTIPSPFTEHQFGFLALWCKINGCESWISNPWVWVIEFERIDKPEDFLL